MTVHVIRSAGLLPVNNDSKIVHELRAVIVKQLFLKLLQAIVINMPTRPVNMKYAHF